MIPATFDYVRTDTLDEALGLLTEHGDDAKLLAGGHSLLPLMKLRLSTPSVLIDIGRLRDLTYVRADGDEVAIGGLTRDRVLQDDPVLATECPLLAHVAGQVGDPQVRARGTIGGSLAHGDPASDLPTAVLALGGSLVLRSTTGTRTVPATEFFVSFLETALQPDEVLVEVRVPRTPGPGWGYEKFTRRANDWPIVAVAAVDGHVALANMGQTVLRATATEQALAGGASVSEASQLADQGTTPGADMHADADYRRHLARLLTRRALEKAAG